MDNTNWDWETFKGLYSVDITFEKDAQDSSSKSETLNSITIESAYATNTFRLLGYYNFPNQRMNPEKDFPEKAAEICKLLNSSFSNLSTSSS